MCAMSDSVLSTKERLDAMLFYLDKAAGFIAEIKKLTEQAIALSSLEGSPPLPDAAFAQLLVALPVKCNIESARLAGVASIDPAEYLAMQLQMYRDLGIDPEAAEQMAANQTMH